MKTRWKKAFLVLLSVSMVTSMMPAAFAGEADTPSVSDISIGSEAGQTYSSAADGAAKRLEIPNDAVVNIASIGMTAAEAVELGDVSASDRNSVWADGENLKVSLRVKGIPYTVTVPMKSTDGISWKSEAGSVPGAGGVTDLPAGTLAGEMSGTDIRVTEGVLKADERNSVAALITMNQDARKVYLYLYPASVPAHTVTYSYGSETRTFRIPDGSKLVDAQVPALDGQSFSGWCTDKECTVPAEFGAVTGDMTLYGKYTEQKNISTLTYKANGGTGEDAAENCQTDSDVTVKKESDVSFTRENYTFSGWNTRADGSGIAYQPGDSFRITENTVLYAQWKADDIWAGGREVSKTAVELNEEYESGVTLSLPAADYKRKIEVEFVIDATASERWKSYRQQIHTTMDKLVSMKNVDVKIGAVGFANRSYPGVSLQSLTDETIQNLKNKIPTSNFVWAFFGNGAGTDIQAGIRAGRDALASGDRDAEKYLILLTDGGAFYWLNDKGESVTKPYMSNGKALDTSQIDTTMFNANPDGLYSIASGTFASFRSQYADQMKEFNQTAITGTKKTALGVEVNSETGYSTRDWSDRERYPFTNMEQGTYNASEELNSVANDGIHVITVGSYNYYPSQPAIHRISNMFLDWTGEIGNLYKIDTGNEDETMEKAFDGIIDELGHYVDAGSYLVDEIGSGTDNHDNAYDFKFVNDIERLTLAVGGTSLEKSQTEENTYSFGTEEVPDQFVLHYYADGTEKDGKKYGECFVLDINVPVLLDAPVELQYAVKLTNPQKSSGKYGDYDADGSKGYTGLYTNNSATLHPVDSNKRPGTPVDFAKPTVSYTVSRSDSGNGGNSGGGGGKTPSDPPKLNTDDHFAYVIGYPEDYRTGESTDDRSLWPVKPAHNITRAEVATIFFRMLTDGSRKEWWMQTNPYSDVKSDKWYNNAVSTLTNADIITGYEDGSFRPDAPITRAEFAAMAARFSDVEYSGENGFSDVADSYWAERYIALAEHLGWIHGYPDGTFRPAQNITRAESMTLVNAVLERTPDAGHMLKDMIRWPDNARGAWYYEAVQEATNSHAYKRKSSRSPEIWTKILKVRSWADLEREWSDANSAENPGEVVKN